MAEQREIKIIQDINIVNMDDFDARRPYYRIRGPRVTEEQAFEIIRLTDREFNMSFEQSRIFGPLGYIGSGHIENLWFTANHVPSPRGWCHPSGIIGVNNISGKYPELDELIWEFKGYIQAFPFLDMIVAVTDWNEMPKYAWDLDWDDPIRKKEEYPDFIENIQIGFWIHNGILEILNQDRAQRVYREYEAKYSEPNRDIYVVDYYSDNHIFPANYDYLRRIVAAYGLNPDEYLKSYIWKDWLDGDPDWMKKLKESQDNQGNQGGMCIIS